MATKSVKAKGGSTFEQLPEVERAPETRALGPRHTEQNVNPHCDRQWPEGFFDHLPPLYRHQVEHLRRDVSAICTITRLLRADESIAQTVRDSDTPRNEHQPFTAMAREGLALALEVCADDANDCLEWMEQHDVNGRAA